MVTAKSTVQADRNAPRRNAGANVIDISPKLAIREAPKTVVRRILHETDKSSVLDQLKSEIRA